MSQENAPGEDTPESESAPKSRTLQEQRRTDMDAACDRLAESHLLVRQRCDAFEALMDEPAPEAARVLAAQGDVRAVAMHSMGLTSSYLIALNAYVKGLG